MKRTLALLALVGCSPHPPEPASTPDSEPSDTTTEVGGEDDAVADGQGEIPDAEADGEDAETDGEDAEADGEDAEAEVGDAQPDATVPRLPAFAVCDAYDAPRTTGNLPSEIPELSGLALSPSNPEVLWGHNDSGDAARVYAFSPEGALLATVELDDVIALDWEDMARGPCGDDECLYVGDIGDNLRLRPWVSVHRFVLPTIDPAELGATLTVEAETARFMYPDGNHDAEALVVDADGRVVFLSKDGRILTVFAGEFSTEEDVEMTLLGNLDIRDTETAMAAVVTGADLVPGERLLVRTYEAAFEYVLGGRSVGAAFDVEPTLVPVASERQGEAIAYGEGGFWTASEDPGAAISFVGCAE